MIRFATQHSLTPLIDWLSVHGRGTASTQLLILNSLVSNSNEQSAPLLALALSPRLLNRLVAQEGPNATNWEGLPFPDNFRPTLAIHGPALARLEAENVAKVDAILAHEWAHTVGLIHRDTSNNLMSPVFDWRYLDTFVLYEDEIQHLQSQSGAQCETAHGSQQSALQSSFPTNGFQASASSSSQQWRPLQAAFNNVDARVPTFLAPIVAPARTGAGPEVTKD